MAGGDHVHSLDLPKLADPSLSSCPTRLPDVANFNPHNYLTKVAKIFPIAKSKRKLPILLHMLRIVPTSVIFIKPSSPSDRCQGFDVNAGL